jgi:predicted AAA+ superfamily ATPase
MIQRGAETSIQHLLKISPAVALLGPRQIGKTTLAMRMADQTPSVYLDLENPLDMQRVEDIVSFHAANSNKLIVLDEVQRMPEIFAPLRGIIDAERRKGNKKGQFLFLGSASVQLLKQSSESLAGRIAYTELFPVNVIEYADENFKLQQKLWLRGGFPESLLAKKDEDSLLWRRNFIRTYLERDIPTLGPRIPASTLYRFWMMLAHYQGSVVNAAHLARNLDVSGMTIGRYLDLLSDLMLVRKLQPWTFNVAKRLVRSPKIYVRDSGIVHALLNIHQYNDLLGHPVVGGSWEGFVIENILSITPPDVLAYYYGTPGGAEIDLILEFSPSERWAIEIKRATAPTVSKGFHLASEEVKPKRKIVVYAGQENFSMKNEIEALSLSQLMQELKS